MNTSFVKGQLIEHQLSKEIGEVLGPSPFSNMVQVKISGTDQVENWEIRNSTAFLPDEQDEDILFFQNELAKIVNGEFQSVVRLEESDQSEVVITFTDRPVLNTARNVDQALQLQFGTCCKMWLYTHSGIYELHVLYWKDGVS